MLADIFTGEIWASETQGILRLLVACLLGGAIGLEREYHGRAAGLRTHMLVSLGAAIAMVVSLHFATVYGGVGGDSPIKVDPARLAYGVMTGIGFIGAGVIFHSGIGVRGLTTAASLWCSAAVGLGSGFGMFITAAAAAGLALFVLGVLEHVERRMPSRVQHIVTVTLAGTEIAAAYTLLDLLKAASARISRSSLTCDYQQKTTTVVFQLDIPASGRQRLEQIIQKFPQCLMIKVE